MLNLPWSIPVGLLCATLLSSAHASESSQLPWGTDISAGGFAKLHLLRGDISANRSGHRGDQQLHIPHIPVDSRPAQDRRRTALHAKDTRFWIRAVTPTEALGDIELLYEADFHDAADAYDIRLRHAYVMAGNVLIGQTYSTFTNTSALAETETGTAPGNVVTRHRLLRWTQPLANNADLQVALEQPLNRISRPGQNAYESRSSGRNPDLVAKLQSEQSWGNLSVAAMAREISLQDPASGIERKRRGTAFSLAGRINTGALNNLRFMFNYGNVLARYSTLGSYTDAFTDEEMRLSLNTVHSSLLSYQHFWTPQWRSSLTLSHSGNRLPEQAGTRMTRSARSLQLNLIWAPSSVASFGIEYLHGQRKINDGRRGEINRLQLTTRINFSR